MRARPLGSNTRDECEQRVVFNCLPGTRHTKVPNANLRILVMSFGRATSPLQSPDARQLGQPLHKQLLHSRPLMGHRRRLCEPLRCMTIYDYCMVRDVVKAPSRARVASRKVPTSGSLQGDQPLAQLQSLAPAAKAGIIHSAAMYTLILQGISGQGSGQSRESLQMHSSARPAAPDTSQRACPSPTAIDKGGANWSRQSTAEVPDDHNRFSRQTTEDPNYSRQTTTFSRQTTEDPSYTSNLSRQTTEEPRRQLPLSQLLSLPEPSERTEPSSRQHSSRASRAGSSEMEAPERTEQSDELNVRLKNTFLHFETAPTGTDGSTKARPSSLPPSLPGRRSQTDRPPSRT